MRPNRIAHTFRFPGVAILLAMLVLPLTAFGVQAQQGSPEAGAQGGTVGGASVTIHKRLCPTGYADNDFFQDCHDNPQEGVTFELGGLRDATGDDGVAYFYDLLGGTYTISENLPGEFLETNVFCSIGGNPDNPASFERVPVGISLTVPDNTDIICDWYNVPLNLRGTPGDGNGDDDTDWPPGASVLIHKRLCPAGYTGDQVYDVCHDNPLSGATFTLDDLTTTTGQDGDALFYQLNPGNYTITEAGQGEFWYYTVVCSLEEDLSQSVDVTYVSNGIQLTVPENTDFICDWYNVPSEGAAPPPDDGEGPGTLTIHKAECPAGYDGSQFYQDCHANRLEGISFDAYGPERYLRQNVTTNAQGTITFDGIAVGGTVSIREDLPPGTAYYVVYCSNSAGERVPFRYVDTETEDGIEIDVFRGDSVLCDWYDVPAA